MKRKSLFLILISSIMCLLFTLIGCNSNTGNVPDDNDSNGVNEYYTVMFDSMGGSAVESQRILKGNLARSPETPEKEDYSFIGWYKSTDENADEWHFSTDRVIENITLYAKWQPIETQPVTPSLTFERNSSGYTVTGATGQEERIIIPAEYEGLPVTEIGESAFAYSRHTSGITYVSIPDTVTTISLNAFYGRSELATVDIDENSGLTVIGRNAFSGNRALKSIYIPQGVTEIGDSAFNSCAVINFNVASDNTVYRSENGHLIETATQTLIRGANNANIPDGIKILEVRSFQRVNGITELNIPKSVTKIGNYFINDSTIEKINYAGTQAEWEQIEKSSTMWNYGNRDVQVAYASAPKILVAYFSCTNNTEGVAQKIAQATDGTLYEITPAVPYTSADLNYNTDCRANREQNDPNARPEITGSVENIEQYDVIFIGYPIWWGQAPKIIYTFLESYDFTGKTIIPFCTSGSSGIGSSATNLHNSARTANWLDGARFSSSVSQSNIQTWIEGILPDNKEN